MLLDSRTFLPIPALPAGSSFSSLLSYYNRSSMFSFRIHNRHHHHPRVPAGGDHHQTMPSPHMPLQGSRKPPSQHYGTSNGMTHGGGMGSKHQHSGMGHPPKTLPYSSSSNNSSSHQHQPHHHQQHNHHSHHHTGHHNPAAIPVVSAAGPGASKTRMIPSHERE